MTAISSQEGEGSPSSASSCIRDVVTESQYISSNCVLYIYYNDLESVIEEHFSKALKTPSSSPHSSSSSFVATGEASSSKSRDLIPYHAPVSTTSASGLGLDPSVTSSASSPHIPFHHQNSTHHHPHPHSSGSASGLMFPPLPPPPSATNGSIGISHHACPSLHPSSPMSSFSPVSSRFDHPYTPFSSLAGMEDTAAVMAALYGSPSKTRGSHHLPETDTSASTAAASNPASSQYASHQWHHSQHQRRSHSYSNYRYSPYLFYPSPTGTATSSGNLSSHHQHQGHHHHPSLYHHHSLSAEAAAGSAANAAGTYYSHPSSATYPSPSPSSSNAWSHHHPAASSYIMPPALVNNHHMSHVS